MKNIFYMTIGSLLFALAVTQLAMPNSIAEGGIVGIALLIYYSLNISPGVSTPIIFVVLLAVGVRYLPRPIVLKTVYNVAVFSLFLWGLEGLYAKPIEDPLLAAIFAGVITGIGFGFIYQAGSSIGGSSIIARMLNHQLGWHLTGVTFAIDVLIVIMGVFIIGPTYTMYTLITLYVGKIVTDFVLGGFDSKKAINIISPYTEEISKRITTELASSATVFYGTGEYSKEQRKVLYIVVHSHRQLKLKRVIKETDPNAFIVVHNVKDVSGGFIS
ncbi:YitT family protein [Pseudalkalibacillus hwajinpoensis]|uniref:YitT family protein n=1 Tax=Guptibacillus hwajinpoensis TaxID=208199 RepID=UPI001CD32E74|nr:YitT family protein [Pseudalkalibacillus hwajinpoensis]MCA0993477.1 YitT family protein [Pseudalkalibacillus hwajinpoensis]